MCAQTRTLPQGCPAQLLVHVPWEGLPLSYDLGASFTWVSPWIFSPILAPQTHSQKTRQWPSSAPCSFPLDLLGLRAVDLNLTLLSS